MGNFRNDKESKNCEKAQDKVWEVFRRKRIIVNAWTLGIYPRYWTEPESYIPKRFLDSFIDIKGNNFDFVPFSAGKRICARFPFGLINIEHPLAFLLYHFDWKLPSGTETGNSDMTESFGATLKR
ncbi:Cytochrome P450, E-class, group I [Parasponia andersonii]|uniref:Cytochrome P450, E-class, group I n=1 Tax=Parasponia andersonii TaxID=3476 RepID=A0A2P5BEW8_PARAD|nr:Cytochrome P450, E-class, group I [Parasponia andersonii]